MSDSLRLGQANVPNNKPLLSVIIPVYNSEEFLARCIKSVLNQSYDTIEVIVVDDGSGVGCMNITKQFMLLDDRVRYFRHITNKGLLTARIKGIELSRGDYITHLDSDDWVSKDVYSKSMAIHTKYNSKLVLFNLKVVDKLGTIEVEQSNKIEYFINKKGKYILNKILVSGGSNWAWHLSHNKTWDAALLKKNITRLPETHLVMCEDLLLSIYFISLLENIPTCSSVNGTKGLYYYKHADSSTGKKNDIHHVIKNIKDLIKVKNFISSLSDSTYLTKNKSLLIQTIKRIGILNYPALKLFGHNPSLFIYAYYLQIRYIDFLEPIKKILRKKP